MPIDKVLERVKRDNVKFVQLQFTDIFGVVKSLTIPVHHLEDSLKHGTWFDKSDKTCGSDLPFPF